MEKRKNKSVRKRNINLLQNLSGKKRNFDFPEEWEKLGKKINEKWDSVSLEDELKFQRNKNS